MHATVEPYRDGSREARAATAAKRCAYYTEQKSLERTFESIDPATIAEVLASHPGYGPRGDGPVEFERAGFRGASNGPHRTTRRRPVAVPVRTRKTAAQDGSFWNDVLGDVTMDDDDEGAAAGASGIRVRRGDDGVTPYASWPADQWSAVEVNVLGTLTEDVNLAEKLVGVATRPSRRDRDRRRDRGRRSIEILVKWKARALTHCSWVALPTLAAALNPRRAPDEVLGETPESRRRGGGGASRVSRGD